TTSSASSTTPSRSPERPLRCPTTSPTTSSARSAPARRRRCCCTSRSRRREHRSNLGGPATAGPPRRMRRLFLSQAGRRLPGVTDRGDLAWRQAAKRQQREGKMRRPVWLRMLLGVCAAAALLMLGVGGASAQNAFHGIAFTKGCDSPTSIGSPYNCSYQVLNVADTAHDTLMVSGLSDQVHAFSGDVNSGNILGALQLVFSGPTVVCVGGSGAGTGASPYVGATSCTLPFGTSITSNPHTFYTVQAADFGLPASTLTD